MQLKTILLLIISLSLSHPSKGWLANEYVLTELPTQQQLPVANVRTGRDLSGMEPGEEACAVTMAIILMSFAPTAIILT